MSLPLRPLLAALVVAGILGGMALYANFLERLKHQAQAAAAARETVVAVPATGKFTIEVTLTFDAAPDGFDPTSLIVERLGNPSVILAESTEPIAAGQRTTFEVEGLAEGENRLYLRATPASGAEDRDLAARIRVFRDPEQNPLPLAEKTFWTQSGERAEGPIEVHIPRSFTTDSPAP